MESKKKEQHLSEIESFCNVINVFTVTFDTFYASLLKRMLDPRKK